MKPVLNLWEKSKAIATVISSVVIPVVVLVVGELYTKAIKERELQSRFVELAVNILHQEPRGDTRNLRQWATDVINEYLGVPLSTEAKREVI